MKRAAIAAISVLSLVIGFGCGGRPETREYEAQESPETADSSLNDREALLAENNSSVTHLENLQQVGHEMLRNNYWADENGTPLTQEYLSRAIGLGVLHIIVPDSSPYKMEWRLRGLGGTDPNDLPVSFLTARYDGPFTHEMASAVVKEVERVGSGLVGLDAVTNAMRDAEAQAVAAKKSEDSLLVSSSLLSVAQIREDGLDYAVKVHISEQRPIEYTLEKGSSMVTVYFAYLPTGRAVDLTQVSGGGFGTP